MRGWPSKLRESLRLVLLSWSMPPSCSRRNAFRYLAAQLNVPCTILAFRADQETLQRRVAQRSTQADDASEADLAVLHGQFTALEPLTDEEQAAALTIDTDAPQAPQRLLEAVHAMEKKRPRSRCRPPSRDEVSENGCLHTARA